MARDANSGPLTAWQVSRIRNYIDEHLSERIQVKDLSAVALLSRSHFCRVFKSTMDETPHNYVIRRRLDRAQSIMLTSDASLCEIALRCGFSDQAHFCRRFRDATGQSPSAWRRMRLKVSGDAVDTSSMITN
jgi:AraC-like DNA-binding protein